MVIRLSFLLHWHLIDPFEIDISVKLLSSPNSALDDMQLKAKVSTGDNVIAESEPSTKSAGLEHSWVLKVKSDLLVINL